MHRFTPQTYSNMYVIGACPIVPLSFSAEQAALSEGVPSPHALLAVRGAREYDAGEEYVSSTTESAVMLTARSTTTRDVVAQCVRAAPHDVSAFNCKHE